MALWSSWSLRIAYGIQQDDAGRSGIPSALSPPRYPDL